MGNMDARSHDKQFYDKRTDVNRGHDMRNYDTRTHNIREHDNRNYDTRNIDTKDYDTRTQGSWSMTETQSGNNSPLLASPDQIVSV